MWYQVFFTFQPIKTIKKSLKKNITMSWKVLSKEDVQRERVYNFYLQSQDNGKQYTVNHFKAEKLSSKTI